MKSFFRAVIVALCLTLSGWAVTPPVLLFVGVGTSPTDVTALKTVLGNQNLSYATATSVQLNNMSQAQMQAYKLLLIPGGNSITIGDNLSIATTTNIRNAVKAGLNYMGFCAGGFFGGGGTLHNNANLTGGIWFNFYKDYPAVHIEAVNLLMPNGTHLDVYWQDGPELSGEGVQWGSVVAKYPDGKPAIIEGHSGTGWVIMTGVHPEAPSSWRTCCTFTTSEAVDVAYAGTLIQAALNGTSLQHF